MELDLSSLPTSMSSSVCACNFEWILALSESWLKYPIDKIPNHVLEFVLDLRMISNGVVSLRPSWPGTWFSIIAACRTAKYQNYRTTCFSVMNDRVIWIKVRHVRSTTPLEYWCPTGRQLCWNRLIISIGGHVHRLISCRSQSETGGVGVPRLLWIILRLKLFTWMIVMTYRRSNSILWPHQL